jgi:hypothetical protein
MLFLRAWPAKFRETFREIFISHFAKFIYENFAKVIFENCTEMKFVYFLKLNS